MPLTTLLINPCIIWSCFAQWTCTSHPYNNDARTVAFTTTLPFIFFVRLSFGSLARTARHKFIAFRSRSQRPISKNPTLRSPTTNSPSCLLYSLCRRRLLPISLRCPPRSFVLFPRLSGSFPELFSLSLRPFLCFCRLDFSLLARRCCHFPG